MRPPQQSQSESMTLEQQLNIALFMADLAAVSVIVLLRGKIGWRTLSVGSALVSLALFCIANPMNEGAFSDTKASNDPFPYRTALPPDRPARPGWLGVFAAISFFAIARQKRLRLLDIQKGLAWHTYHRGISRLSFLPFQDSTLAKSVEPALCMLAGFICWRWLSVSLGLWLIFAGAALRFVEQWIYKRQLERTLDMADATIEGPNLSDLVEQFEQHPSARVYDGDDAKVVHARLSDNVETLISRRKQSSTKKTGTGRPPRSMLRLSMRQRFWRFFWGRHAYDWWQRRHGR